MKKIILLLVSFFLIIIIWRGAEFYRSVTEPLNNQQQLAVKYVEEQLNIEKINRVDFFHGEIAYHVINAMLDSTPVFVFVPETLDNIIIRNVDQGITYTDAKNIVEKERNPKKITAIKLGIEKNIPLYEVTYLNQQNQYVFYYLTFKNGRYLKHYELKK